MDLKQDRIEKGYSQKEWAAKLGVSERTIRYWESGSIEVDPLKMPELIRRSSKLKAQKKIYKKRRVK